MVPHRWTHPLLGWTVVLGFTLSFVGCLGDHFGDRRKRLPLLFTSRGRLPYQRPFPTYLHLLKMTGLTKDRRIRHKEDLAEILTDEGTYDVVKRCAVVGLQALASDRHNRHGGCRG